jgi:hypothetical protein
MNHHQAKKTSVSSGLHASLLATGILFLFAQAPVEAAKADPRAGFAISAGFFDIADEDFEVAELGIEYRFKPFHLFHGVDLKPMAGVSANEDEAFWLYGGLRYDFAFAKHWVVSPSIAATIYEEGNSKDLGGAFHIRSSLEVSYRFTDGQRLGIAFDHVSNAGIEEKNPGANSLVLVWTF